MYKLLIACALALTFTDAPVFAKGRQAEDFHSNIAYVVDVDSGEVLVDRNSLAISPIASISKLMASIVVLESGQGLAEPLRIEREDIARQSSAKWKLKVGTEISRMRVLRVGLMSSENRAINALARSYVGGTGAFVAAMNLKAKELGMAHTHFIEPTGLSPQNVSTAQDLVLLLQESMRYRRKDIKYTCDELPVPSGFFYVCHIYYGLAVIIPQSLVLLLQYLYYSISCQIISRIN